MPYLLKNGSDDMAYVVTGGSSGIGRALTIKLAQLGHAVIICGRDLNKLEQTAACFPELITYVVGDITALSTREALLAAVGKRELKALIQNAGTIEPIMPVTEIDLAQWERCMAVNVKAPIAVFQFLKNHLIGGRVLHISSAAAHYPFNHWGAYCMSKAALYMLYQTLKLECSDIAFGSVMPGITDTAMQALIRQHPAQPSEGKSYFKRLHEENRLLTPEVVAQFLSWLLLETDNVQFQANEWDIYDKTHHCSWLQTGKVPEINE